MLDNTCVITFANTEIHKKYQKQFHSKYQDNFSQHIAYTEDDIIGTDFYNDNQHMFQYRKYFGYFLWKPYIILKTMRENPKMDVLYCDSNLRFTDFLSFEKIYITLMDTQGAFFVRHDNFINREWTKRDCFLLMNSDTETYWEANQVWTPLMGFKSTARCLDMLDRYMYYCRNPRIASEQPNILGEPNLEGFREHRWEQSIMSILVKKYGYNGVPDSQMMKWVTKEYSPELLKMKEEVNENPLAKSI